MREISPSINYSVEEFFEQLSLSSRKIVKKIREEKIKGLRPLPSEKLIDCSTVLNSDFRKKLLNKVAMYVDENFAGRSEMCSQFASLMSLSLRNIGIQSREVFGKSHYYQNGKEVFVWEHAWVRIGKEVIDGNVDILYENPVFPSSIEVSPYWGVIDQVPNDRKLVENKTIIYPHDEDVNKIWWPELHQWLKENT